MKAVIAVVVLLAGFSWGLAGQNESALPSPTPTSSPTPAPSPSLYWPAPGAKKIRISSGVANSLLRHKVDPVYPLDAKTKHIAGDVILQATIDPQGNVTNLAVVQGDPILAKSALKAVKQWKYKPYTMNGQVFEAETTIKIQYYM